ncbi:hypothetical protein [Ruminococcus albus]|uniref:PH domain-containing protein n=1 Tax=Ruminococcus albus TaxID=1264 RepID=A0A1I1K5E9_RUMAL|nr:hypothetical protein [Ruminococcus albus]SFC56074.1 hypothetical protein SAMN02910406_01937 [Ruminococcus albus]
MKNNYTRASDFFSDEAIAWSGILPLFILLPLYTTIDNDKTIFVPIILIGIFAPIIVMSFLNVMMQEISFDANDTQVTFSCLGKNTVIRYGEIKDMKIERRNNEFKTRSGIQRCYVETLTITTASETHVFSAKMDIDYDKVAANPAELTVQFENSKFSRLKNYIEERIYINI